MIKPRNKILVVSLHGSLSLKARMQRGNIRLKQGELDSALDDFEFVVI